MGYQTYFDGEFQIYPPLKPKDKAFLEKFNREDHREEDKGYPGIWCQWVPNDDGTAIVWDEGEKFYEYIEWIKYLITNILEPRGYELNGKVHWDGEESEDKGYIIVTKNKVFRSDMKEIEYENPEPA